MFDPASGYHTNERASRPTELAEWSGECGRVQVSNRSGLSQPHLTLDVDQSCRATLRIL